MSKPGHSCMAGPTPAAAEAPTALQPRHLRGPIETSCCQKNIGRTRVMSGVRSGGLTLLICCR